MKLEPMLQELEGVAEALDVKVKYEALAATVGRGGLCKVKGEYRVIIDRRATTAERVATLARALAELDTSTVSLSRSVRAALERYGVKRAS